MFCGHKCEGVWVLGYRNCLSQIGCPHLNPKNVNQTCFSAVFFKNAMKNKGHLACIFISPTSVKAPLAIFSLCLPSFLNAFLRFSLSLMQAFFYFLTENGSANARCRFSFVTVAAYPYLPSFLRLPKIDNTLCHTPARSIEPQVVAKANFDDAIFKQIPTQSSCLGVSAVHFWLCVRRMYREVN